MWKETAPVRLLGGELRAAQCGRGREDDQRTGSVEGTDVSCPARAQVAVEAKCASALRATVFSFKRGRCRGAASATLTERGDAAVGGPELAGGDSDRGTGGAVVPRQQTAAEEGRLDAERFADVAE